MPGPEDPVPPNKSQTHRTKQPPPEPNRLPAALRLSRVDLGGATGKTEMGPLLGSGPSGAARLPTWAPRSCCSVCARRATRCGDPRRGGETVARRRVAASSVAESVVFPRRRAAEDPMTSPSPGPSRGGFHGHPLPHGWLAVWGYMAIDTRTSRVLVYPIRLGPLRSPVDRARGMDDPARGARR